MNANELADIVDQWAYSESAEYLTDAANMLRQQAELIRNLQKSLGFKNSGYETINLTPQLELTDEEMVSIYESSYLQSGLDEWEFDPVYFARAILRKAQEK